MSKKHAKKKKNDSTNDKKSGRKELSPFEKANQWLESNRLGTQDKLPYFWFVLSLLGFS